MKVKIILLVMVAIMAVGILAVTAPKTIAEAKGYSAICERIAREKSGWYAPNVNSGVMSGRPTTATLYSSYSYVKDWDTWKIEFHLSSDQQVKYQVYYLNGYLVGYGYLQPRMTPNTIRVRIEPICIVYAHLDENKFPGSYWVRPIKYIDEPKIIYWEP